MGKYDIKVKVEMLIKCEEKHEINIFFKRIVNVVDLSI